MTCCCVVSIYAFPLTSCPFPTKHCNTQIGTIATTPVMDGPGDGIRRGLNPPGTPTSTGIRTGIRRGLNPPGTPTTTGIRPGTMRPRRLLIGRPRRLLIGRPRRLLIGRPHHLLIGRPHHLLIGRPRLTTNLLQLLVVKGCTVPTQLVAEARAVYSARETVIPMPIARVTLHASKGMALSRSQVAAAVAWKVRKLG